MDGSAAVYSLSLIHICKHDFGKGRGDDGGEHRVKGEVRDKPRKVAPGQGTRRQEQGRRHQEHKGPLGEGQVDGLGCPANIRLICLLYTSKI